jgi:tetratricopeptide (TPR) repeat protein
MALVRLEPAPGPFRDYLANLALPRLEQALVEAPGDAAAWEERGWALAIRGRSGEAVGCFETALRKGPGRESALDLAALLSEQLKRSDEALAYTRRLVAADPWPWKYRHRLAQLLGQHGQWTDALGEAEAALRLNPFSSEARSWLITCCLHCGQQARAEKEFATLLALNPGREGELRAWLAGQGK